MSHRIDYVWLDVNGNIREKSMFNNIPQGNIYEYSIWTFDGSSCGLATTDHSDLILKPVHAFPITPTSTFTHHTILLCEVYNGDMTPHCTNYRYNYMKIVDAAEKYKPLFGIEQEYVIIQQHNEDYMIKPYLWVSRNGPFTTDITKENCENKQGEFYCGVGAMKAFGRCIVEEHVTLCRNANIAICGINAEVMPSQWEYQIGPIPGEDIADQLIISRYLLKKAAEKYGADITFHPKPMKGWNGSGGHTNFSTYKMRNSYDAIIEACEKLKTNHTEHMKVYGEYNVERLCGSFETSNPYKFTYGVGDRSCSVRIPQQCYLNKKGYLEDRRPAANMNPYLVCGKILSTVCLI